MAESRKEKKGRVKYDPLTVYKSAISYYGTSQEALESVSLSREIKYIRRVIFYLLFMHTNHTVINIRKIINVPQNRMNEAINEARIDIANGSRKITTDISLILNIINNSL